MSRSLCLKRCKENSEHRRKYLKHGKVHAIVDPKVWRPFGSRFSKEIENGSITVEMENKGLLEKRGDYLLLKLLNIVDAVIRWAKNLFAAGKAKLYVRLRRGTLIKK